MKKRRVTGLVVTAWPTDGGGPGRVKERPATNHPLRED